MQNVSLRVIILLLVMLAGCANNEQKEKIDLERIKENRRNLDYRDPKQGELFIKFDDTLKKWANAKKLNEHAYASALEQKLYDQARGHFSQVVTALQSGDFFNKSIAAAVLGFSEDIRAISYLIEALQYPHPTVRSNAAMSLGHIGSNQTPMDVLFKTLHEDPDARVRGMVCYAITQIVTEENDEQALPHLLSAIQDSSPQVRNHVAIALGIIGGDEVATAILTTILHDDNYMVRYNAIRTLGQLEDIDEDEVIPALIKKLRDPILLVRQAAYSVLKKITGKDFSNSPQQWEEWAGVPSSAKIAE